jgi:putative ABC transport system permease protein
MNLTLKIAWRNIWRNKRRSYLVLGAIVTGLWGMVYMIALSEGMNQQMVQTAIESGIGDIQIHRAGFEDNMDITKNIRDPGYFIKRIEGLPFIKSYAERIKVLGLVSSAESSSGVLIWGIDPTKEPTVSAIKTYLKQGKFLDNEPGGIYIGKSLADKLNVGLDDKIVLMGQGLSPDIGSAAYRVRGIYVSSSPEFDKFNVYINLADARDLLSMGNRVSEIVIIADRMDHVDPLAVSLRDRLAVSDLEVLTWRQLSPIIVEMIDMFNSFNYIIYIIVILAMAFGIINTILMSVLERTREIGILMAIGTKPGRVFWEVMSEGFMLGLVGLTVGWTINLIFYAIVSHTGIDLSMWAGSLKYMGGIGAIIYPKITISNVIKSTIAVFVATQVSALYPAVKITRLSPVKAIRSL